MSRPLEGLKVLDLTRVLAGPFAGRMLSDLGADVVKVEPPEGDVTRLWGKEVAGIRGYFAQQNSGKRGLCIDLNHADGPALVRELAAQADILIENFRPGVLARFGLAWEDLEPANPRLLMASISGFGQTGPERGRAAYAPIIHAETGVTARQAAVHGHPPVEIALSVADTNAALHALVGLLAALHQRQATGRGQHLDIAMVDAMLCTDDYTHFVLEDEVDTRLPSEVWQATGGPVLVSADFRYLWKLLTQHMGLADPTPPGAALEEKVRLRRAAAEAWFTGFATRDELVAALDGMNLAWGDVRSGRQVLDLPTLAHRGTVARVDDRQGGERPIVQSPYRYSSAESGVRGGAPHQGEHNAEVLDEWLGMDADAVAALAAAGALRGPGDAQQ